MKVTIIGGGGRVGSCAAYALQCGGLLSEIQILDANLVDTLTEPTVLEWNGKPTDTPRRLDLDAVHQTALRELNVGIMDVNICKPDLLE